jgi:hypothetical protein
MAGRSGGSRHDDHDKFYNAPVSFDLATPACSYTRRAGVQFSRPELESMEAVPVDLAPFQVPDLTSSPLLHFLFAICTYGRMYVTWQGKLVGVVFKGDFLSEKWIPRDDPSSTA